MANQAEKGDISEDTSFTPKHTQTGLLVNKCQTLKGYKWFIKPIKKTRTPLMMLCDSLFLTLSTCTVSYKIQAEINVFELADTHKLMFKSPNLKYAYCKTKLKISQERITVHGDVTGW